MPHETADTPSPPPPAACPFGCGAGVASDYYECRKWKCGTLQIQSAATQSDTCKLAICQRERDAAVAEIAKARSDVAQICAELREMENGIGKAIEIRKSHEAELSSLREQVRRLRADLLRLHDATIILRNGMGGHNHWDNTQRHGAGCPICIAQQQARREAQKLIDQVGPSAVREQLEREGTK